MPTMNRTLSEIAEEALALPQSDRLRLVRTLLEKAEACGDVGAEAAWEDEIERRISRIDAGLATGRSFEEVLRAIAIAHGHRRPEFWMGRF
jgi:putative addiction module component (TIGR02574 family)